MAERSLDSIDNHDREKEIEVSPEQEVELAPNGWANLTRLARNTGTGSQTILDLVAPFRQTNSEWFKTYRASNNVPSEYFHPDLIFEIEKSLDARVPLAPEGWMTNGALMAEYENIAYNTVQRVANPFRESHPEWFKMYRFRAKKGGRASEHFHPDLVAEIRKGLAMRPDLPPEGWYTNKALSKILGAEQGTITRLVNQYRESHPEWFRMYSYRRKGGKGEVAEHFHPDLIEKIRLERESRSHAPEGWHTKGSLAKLLGNVVYATVGKVADQWRDTHPEWFREYKDGSHKISEHYHPDLVVEIRKVLEKRPGFAPAGWMRKAEVSERYNISETVINKRLPEYRASHPEWFGEYCYTKRRGTAYAEHYHPDLVEKIVGSIERVPEDWYTLGKMSRTLGVNINDSTLKELVQKFYESHPAEEKPVTYTGQKKQVLTRYPPAVFAYIKEIIEAREYAPEEWETLTAIETKLDIPGSTAKKIIDKIYQNNKDLERPKKLWHLERGRLFLHYPPQISILLAEELERLREAEPDPGSKKTIRVLARELKVDRSTIRGLIDQFYEENSDATPPEELTVKNTKGVYYPPEVEDYVKKAIENKLSQLPPEGWYIQSVITKELGIGDGLFAKFVSEFYTSNENAPQPERFISMRRKRFERHYPPEVFTYIKEASQTRSFEQPPEGWQTVHALAKDMGMDRETITRQIDDYYAKNADVTPPRDYLVQGNIPRLHYPPEVIEYIWDTTLKAVSIPEGWMHQNAISKFLGISIPAFQRAVQKFLSERPDAHELIGQFRAKGAMLTKFYSPEIIDYARKEMELKAKNTEDELNSFFENPDETEKFRKLISLFGSGQAIDILYALHPEYKEIPIGKVNSSLAEYLGEYLLTAAPFSPENLSEAEALFGVPGLMEGLTDVIKLDALQKVLAHREKAIGENTVLFRKYFEELRKNSKDLGSPELMHAIIDAERFYISLLSLKVPEGMRESLREDREFPDIYQRINVREIEAKKRLVIADEMGAGKSASAIIAKEHLGIKTALVTVPSNALDTWEGYLSNRVDQDGTRVGYFEENPKVLRVSGIEDLKEITPGLYDYILISHERLNQDYTNALEGLDYGMLIVDEIHKLKNLRQGVRSEHLLRLAENREGEEKYVALLSGTPVPNKVEDIAILLKLPYPERFAAHDNKNLIRSIIHGDLLNLRQLLIPRLQMKNLGEHIEMPELQESIELIELTSQEEEIYQVLLDEDELTPTEKMHLLQKFLLSPELLDITPETPSSKIQSLDARIGAAFQQEDRVVLFVNDYIEGVIRGENNILQNLSIPSDVVMRVIHGGVSPEERLVIQKDFQARDKRMLLVISGQTADVAVDYSAGEKIIHYNEPWTVSDKHQQQSRVYRPGIEDDIESVTLLTKGTIEEGKHEYIQTKHRAIEKLLRGIPITEIEMEILEKSESAEKADLSVNSELADYYFSSFERLNRIFASVKEMGEKKFSVFLERHGEEYADCYRELGSRSYQSNASRVVATLIEKMIHEREERSPRILDLASGPEMLWRHSSDNLRPNIVSVDINPEHFKDSVSENETIVGSFTNVPLPDASIDYVNLSLALHYTRLVPSKNEYERLEALREMGRVLKTGGRGVINMIYSLDFREPERIERIAEGLGLKVISEYTGEVASGSGYRSRVITLEKTVEEVDSLEDLIEKYSKEDLDAIKFARTEKSLKDSRKIISNFTLGDEEFSIELNADDQKLSAEEKSIVQEVEALKVVYGSVKEIPRETIIERGFIRIRTGKSKYVLFKRIEGSGAVIVR